MDDVYENIDDYNPVRKKKLIVLDEMIADMMTNKKFQAIIEELFIRRRKLNTSLVFITQSFFRVPKDVRLNSTDYLIIKIDNKKELQNIGINHSVDIDYKDFWKIYRFTDNVQENFSIYWQLILRYQQVIHWDLEKNCFNKGLKEEDKKKDFWRDKKILKARLKSS